MPIEYYPYLFLIQNESLDGYIHAFKMILDKIDNDCSNFGEQTRRSVLNNKITLYSLSDY